MVRSGKVLLNILESIDVMYSKNNNLEELETVMTDVAPDMKQKNSGLSAINSEYVQAKKIYNGLLYYANRHGKFSENRLV